MTKKEIVKSIKEEVKEIHEEYKDCNWEGFGIDEDRLEEYSRGYHDALKDTLTMLNKK
ncbi:MAG: hypothetical protein NTZ97_02465 [Candidatus Moranbacteria bacterium]|nr:hypothetical protein [Candidatus Moranbacteria bacterium]